MYRLLNLLIIAALGFWILSLIDRVQAGPRPREKNNQLEFPIEMPLPSKPPHSEQPQAELDSVTFGADTTAEEKSVLDEITEVLGQGYNSITGNLTGDCVDGAVNGARPASYNQSYTLSLIQSSEQLKEEMKAEASVSGGFAAWTAKASAKYESSREAKQNSDFLLIKVKCVASPNVLLHSPKLKSPPGTDAASQEKFFEECGDSYVKGVTLGGEFVTMLTFDRSDENATRSFEGSLSVGGPSVSVDASMMDKLVTSKSKLHLFVEHQTVGGSGGGPTDDTMDALKTFATSFRGTLTPKNIAYVGNTTDSYRTLRVSPPPHIATAASKVAALRAGIRDRNKSLLQQQMVLDQRRKQEVPDEETQATMAKLNDEVARMRNIIEDCGQHPTSPHGECNVPPELTKFTPPPVKNILVTPLPVRSGDPVGWTIHEPGRKVIISGRMCLHNYEQCFANGTGGNIEIKINNNTYRYAGTPMDVPVTYPQDTIVAIRILDSDYGDNTGDLKAILY